MRPQTMRRIGVVGGGASGTITAVRLLEISGRDVEVVLIDPSGDPGPGIPYRTHNPDHLLNVIAARMSAIEGDPDHFLDWLREKDPSIEPGAYMSRGVYGEYLRELLRRADELRPAESRGLRVIQAEVEAVEKAGDSLLLELKGAPPIRCDEVVLATGALPVRDPVPVSRLVRERNQYICDVWKDEWLSEAQEDEVVMVMGTGLTMVDATLSLCRSGRVPRVIAVSRNGLFPRAHREGFVRLKTPDLPSEGEINLEDAQAIFLELEAEAIAAGGDWRDAMDAMRRITPDVWRRMPLPDRRRFIQDLRRTWEIHRFRMAPEVSRRFDSLLDKGRLEVIRGDILRIESSGDLVAVEIETDGSTRTVEVDRIVNCTGAGREITDETSPLLASMIEKGMVSEDALRLGLDVTPDGRATEVDGKVSRNISVVGPLRRGVEWEAIGITEIRVQAARVAERLSGETGIEGGHRKRKPIRGTGLS